MKLLFSRYDVNVEELLELKFYYFKRKEFIHESLLKLFTIAFNERLGVVNKINWHISL